MKEREHQSKQQPLSQEQEQEMVVLFEKFKIAKQHRKRLAAMTIQRRMQIISPDRFGELVYNDDNNVDERPLGATKEYGPARGIHRDIQSIVRARFYIVTAGLAGFLAGALWTDDMRIFSKRVWGRGNVQEKVSSDKPSEETGTSPSDLPHRRGYAAEGDAPDTSTENTENFFQKILKSANEKETSEGRLFIP